MRKGRHDAGKEGIAGMEGTAGKVLRNTEKEKKKQEKPPVFGRKSSENRGFFCVLREVHKRYYCDFTKLQNG